MEPVDVSASRAQASDLSAEFSSASAHLLTSSSNIAAVLFLMFFLIQMVLDICCVVFVKPSLCLIRNSCLIFGFVKHQEQNHAVFQPFSPGCPFVDVCSLVARSILLLSSEHGLCIVLTVCDCRAPKDVVNTIMQKKTPRQTQPRCSDPAQCLFSPTWKSVLQGLQASESRVQGKI